MAVKRTIRNAALAIFLLAPGMAAGAPAGNSLTILIDGFASASPLIGFGFRNLKERIPGAQLYSHVGAVEGWTYIAPKVVRDVREAYRSDPDIEINLIGTLVADGVVTLWGGTNSEAEKKAIRVAAETVPGVKPVEDKIGVFPPSIQAVMWVE